ncbi:MAG TPA: type VI secretion system amidase immunity protein Tai4 [Pseudomonas sp.]
MIKKRLCIYTAIIIGFCSSVTQAEDKNRNSPQAGTRTYAQNYKDMALATCITTAYKHDADVAKDAGSSVSALRDWGSCDLEQGPYAIRGLVDDYLTRDYHNPIVESEVKGVRFDLLKCLDMYHSEALEAQVKRWVSPRDRTYRQDASLPLKAK